MFISPTKAVKMYNVSKPTLYKDMSQGKLSHNKDDRNRRKINVAELDRLYQKRQDVSADLTSINVNPGEGLTGLNVNNQQLAREIKSIREQIEQAKDREIELLQDQVEQLKSQNENLNRYLDETREEHRGYMRRLEDKREEQGAKTSQWDQKLQSLEHQLMELQAQNRLLVSREEERKKRIEERRRKRETEKIREQEKSKVFFNRLLGIAGQGA